MDKKSQKTLLAVLAHPDDESFGMGGTLALYAQQGVSVHLICATRGEVGSVAPEFLEEYESVEELRAENELRCAANILGLTSVHFLGYRDSGMAGSPDNHHPRALAAQPVENVATVVANYIRQLKPQVVLTFDPLGGYKHPDHIAIHRATVKAIDLASNPSALPEDPDLPAHQVSKLYYHVFPKHLFRFAIFLMRLRGQDPRRWGKNQDIDLIELTREADFPVHARIDIRSVQNAKEAAIACHASQLDGGGPSAGILGWLFRRAGLKDNFSRAYPPPYPGLREMDLFA